MKTLMVLPKAVRSAPTGLLFKPGLPIKAWKEIGQGLRYVQDGLQWWVGDWSNYGASEYGDEYEKERDATGFEYSTINHFRVVANAIEFSRRRINVSWSIHAEVTALAPAEQDRLLMKAEKERLTVALLRALIRRERQLPMLPAEGGSAAIEVADALAWLPAQEPCDLLITDPPFATDIENIEAFAKGWLPLALSKVKPTGRAFVCIGPYPLEVHAYLAVREPEQILIWVYRNTLGPLPKRAFFRNYQMILYYKGPEAPSLLGEEILDRLAAFEINAPVLRQHQWEKPVELGDRLIRLVPGQLVLDPFAGSGTFLLAAAALGRTARGCDLDPESVRVARGRGCGV